LLEELELELLDEFELELLDELELELLDELELELPAYAVPGTATPTATATPSAPAPAATRVQLLVVYPMIALFRRSSDYSTVGRRHESSVSRM
jgi:hypothetical protein